MAAKRSKEIEAGGEIDLQWECEKAIIQGARRLVLHGQFTGPKQRSLLELNRMFDGVEIIGDEATLDGQQRIAHVLVVDGARDVQIKNLAIRNGSTERQTWPSMRLKNVSERTSLYKIIDGSNVSVSGNSWVTFESCPITGGRAYMCGGISIQQSRDCLRPVIFQNCLIAHNRSADTGAGLDLLTSGSKALVIDCTFKNNFSNQLLKGIKRNGQISVFPGAELIINGGRFIDKRGKDYPFVDYQRGGNVKIVPEKLENRLSSRVQLTDGEFNARYFWRQFLHGLKAAVYFRDQVYPWIARD